MKLRLALREEGSMWNAYIAREDTMEGARLIGCIAMGAVRRDDRIKEAFKQVMMGVVRNAVENVTGSVIEDWETREAPAHEKAGNA